jgi:hypothetical protein
MTSAPAQATLPGYCWRCCDTRVVTVYATGVDRHGDRYCIEELVPCPACATPEGNGVVPTHHGPAGSRR